MAGAEGQPRLDLDGRLAGRSLPRSWEPCTRNRPARTGCSPSSDLATQSMSGSTFAPDRLVNANTGHDGEQAMFDLVDLVDDIKRDFLDALGLIEIENRDGQAVLLESGFQRREKPVRAGVSVAT